MNNAVLASEQSSPRRNRAEIGWLLFGVFAGPVAWGLQLIFNYALAAYSCYPDHSPRIAVLPGWQHVWAVILALNLIAAALALAGAAISYRSWDLVRGRNQEPALAAGLGRTRFLALCGMMTGLGFLAAIAFNTLSVFVVPQCVG